MIKKRNGYWRDFENVRQRIGEFMREHGLSGEMPTTQMLNAAGLRTLVVAIHRYHGGFPEAARRLNLALRTKPKSYWKDFENIRNEVLEFNLTHGQWGVMPTEQELNAAGKRTLVVAIYKYHGGFPNVARRLDFAPRCGPATIISPATHLADVG